MTKLIPEDKCPSCAGMLVPPIVAPQFQVPQGTEYVCLKCGRPFRWDGTRLVIAAPETRRFASDDDAREQ